MCPLCPDQDHSRFPVMLVLGLSTLPDIYLSMLPSDVLGPMRVQSLRLSTVQSRLEDFFESEYSSLCWHTRGKCAPMASRTRCGKARSRARSRTSSTVGVASRVGTSKKGCVPYHPLKISSVQSRFGDPLLSECNIAQAHRGGGYAPLYSLRDNTFRSRYEGELR